MSWSAQKISTFCQYALLVIFNILLFFTPFVFTWVNQELFEFNKMLFVYALTALLIAFWFVRLIVEKKWQRRPTIFDLTLLIFLLSQVLSTIFSIHHRTSFFGYYSRFNGGLLSILTYLSIYLVVVNNFSKKHLPLFLDSLLLSGFFVSLYAIPEHFGHSPSCWLITQHFDVSCWREQVQIRVFGTFGQPNWLATYLGMLLPLNLAWLWQAMQTKPWSKSRVAFLTASLVAMVLALLYSKSRSGLLAFGISLVAFWILQLLPRLWQKMTSNVFRSTVRAALVSSLALIALGALAGSIYTPSLSTLLRHSFSPTTPANIETTPDETTNRIEEGGSASTEIRKVVWEGALKVWQRYPLFGSGVETFAYSYYKDRPVQHNELSEWNLLYNKAHNELLNFLANTGIVGLLSYLAIFVTLLVWLFPQWQKGRLSPTSTALACGLLAMFVANFFGFSTVVSNLLLFVFLAFLWLEQTAAPAQGLLKKDNNLNHPLSYHQLFGSVFVLVTAFFLISRVWNIWSADYWFTVGQNAFDEGSYQQGLLQIETAIQKSPAEALFYDQLGTDYANLAVALAESDSTSSAQLAQAALQLSDKALSLNNRHLNFYKSRISIFIKLAQLNSQFYQQAADTLQTAIQLAPTDAKLYYNLALLEAILGKKQQALTDMEYAVQIKSNYSQARNELANQYLELGRLNDAANQYRYILQHINPNDTLVQEKLRTLEASLSAQAASAIQ